MSDHPDLPAPVWRRLVAFALDVTAAQAIALSFGIAVGGLLWAVQAVTGNTFPAAARVVYAIALLAPVPAAYVWFVVTEARSGQTLGKHLLGLEVRRHPGGSAPGHVRVLIRRASGVAAGTLGLPLLAAGFDRERRIAHDWLTRTRVRHTSNTIDVRAWAAASLPRRSNVAPHRDTASTETTEEPAVVSRRRARPARQRPAGR